MSKKELSKSFEDGKIWKKIEKSPLLKWSLYISLICIIFLIFLWFYYLRVEVLNEEKECADICNGSDSYNYFWDYKLCTCYKDGKVFEHKVK